jgi:hypothetical protein
MAVHALLQINNYQATFHTQKGRTALGFTQSWPHSDAVLEVNL